MGGVDGIADGVSVDGIRVGADDEGTRVGDELGVVLGAALLGAALGVALGTALGIELVGALDGEIVVVALGAALGAPVSTNTGVGDNVIQLHRHGHMPCQMVPVQSEADTVLQNPSSASETPLTQFGAVGDAVVVGDVGDGVGSGAVMGIKVGGRVGDAVVVGVVGTGVGSGAVMGVRVGPKDGCGVNDGCCVGVADSAADGGPVTALAR